MINKICLNQRKIKEHFLFFAENDTLSRETNFETVFASFSRTTFATFCLICFESIPSEKRSTIKENNLFPLGRLLQILIRSNLT